MSKFKERMIDTIVQMKLNIKQLQDFDVSAVTYYTVDDRYDDKTINVYDMFCDGYQVKAFTTADRNAHPLQPQLRYLKWYNRYASQRLYVAGFSVGVISDRMEKDDALFVILRTEGTIKHTRDPSKVRNIEEIVEEANRSGRLSSK